MAITGPGKGTLPAQASMLRVENRHVHVTCVKQAEDGEGVIVRLFNPTDRVQPITLTWGLPIQKAWRCRMSETIVEALPIADTHVTYHVKPKKISTVRIQR
jgi:alpha-mannosidase